MMQPVRVRILPVLTLAILFCLAVPFCLSGEGVPAAPAGCVPSVLPGTYASPQLVSFASPAGTRLVVSLDGGPSFEPLSPLLLTVPEGSRRDFTVLAELHSVSPGSPVISSSRFLWCVDREAPAAPRFDSLSVDGGTRVTMTLNESGSISYRMYHPYSGSSSSESVPSGTTVFLPSGTHMYASGTDLAGNTGPAAAPEGMSLSAGQLPYRVLNPVPGEWANSQALLVDHESGTDIFYSIDGSDPGVSGLAYSGPVLLETSGLTNLQLLAVDRTGKEYRDRIMYSVTAVPPPPVSGIDLSRPLPPTGEFAEIGIPENCSYSLGSPDPLVPGGKPVLVTAIPGALRYYPLTVSDGRSRWRWICPSGNSAPVPPQTPPPAGMPAQSAVAPQQTDSSSLMPAPPVIRIISWYYVEIDYPYPVYYSLDGRTWLRYGEPVFVDRSADRDLLWYSAEWKKGEVQKTGLPAKPEITGIPANGISSNPVFLTVDESPFEFFYETGAEFRPASPSEASPGLSSGVLFEVPSGASAPFSVRLQARKDGIVHGELETSFVVDRKPPRAPSPGFPADTVWSRVPVTVLPSGEDMIQTSISPPLFSADGKAYVLTGEEGKSVDYTVSLFSVDRAGNRSATVTRKLTVDLNSLFVDASVQGAVTGNGSPALPFATLDEALDAVRGTGLWRIRVTGQTRLERPHTVLADLRIEADGATVACGPGASLVISGGSLALHGGSFTTTVAASSARSRLPVRERCAPLFGLQNAVLTFRNVTALWSGDGSGSLIRASGSRISLADTRLGMDGPEYAQLLDLGTTELDAESCILSATAPDASVISLVSSGAVLTGTTLSVTASTAARAVEGWESRLSMKDMKLERKPLLPASGSSGTPAALPPNRDTAVWLDRQSRIVSDTGVSVSGFWRYSQTENR